jgi:hypothetical protein
MPLCERNRSAVAMVVYLTVFGPATLASQKGTSSVNCADLVPEEVVFTSAVGTVSFPHLLHQEMEIPCEDCHHETLAQELSMPHPEYFADFWIRCETCHRTGQRAQCAQQCSTCHHGSPTTEADESLSSKVVIHRACWTCHPVGRAGEASGSCKTCHRSGPRGVAG